MLLGSGPHPAPGLGGLWNVLPPPAPFTHPRRPGAHRRPRTQHCPRLAGKLCPSAGPQHTSTRGGWGTESRLQAPLHPGVPVLTHCPLTVALPAVSAQLVASVADAREGPTGVEAAVGTLGLACGAFVHICTGEMEAEGSGLLAWEVRPPGGGLSVDGSHWGSGLRAQTQGSLPTSCSKAP